MDVRLKAFTEAAIDDLSKLSHIYDAEEFTAIVARLPAYARLMLRVNETLSC